MTICFADLDGADGLWVPEERTILVNRRLSDREVAEVIEHELRHVAIDDQHADLDAGVGRPPAQPRRWAALLTAAACLAVVGGTTAVLTLPTGAVREGPVVAPSAPPLTGSSPAPESTQVVVVVRTVGPDGKVVLRTVTTTESAPPAPPPQSPSTTPAASATAARVSPKPAATSAPVSRDTVPAPAPTTTAAPPPATTPPATVSPVPSSALPESPQPTASVVAGTGAGGPTS